MHPLNSHVRMKQLDVVVSPQVFVWDPNLTLTQVTFDLYVKCQTPYLKWFSARHVQSMSAWQAIM